MKTFIGKGTKHAQFDIIDVVIDMAKLDGLVLKTQNGNFLKCSVALRKQPDNFGATHSVSVWQPDAPAPTVAAEPKRRLKKVKANG